MAATAAAQTFIISVCSQLKRDANHAKGHFLRSHAVVGDHEVVKKAMEGFNKINGVLVLRDGHGWVLRPDLVPQSDMEVLHRHSMLSVGTPVCAGDIVRAVAAVDYDTVSQDLLRNAANGMGDGPEVVEIVNGRVTDDALRAVLGPHVECEDAARVVFSYCTPKGAVAWVKQTQMIAPGTKDEMYVGFLASYFARKNRTFYEICTLMNYPLKK